MWIGWVAFEKKIKIPIFSKILIYFCYHGSFVINKNVHVFEIPRRGRFWIALGWVLWAKYWTTHLRGIWGERLKNFVWNRNFSRTARWIGYRFIDNFVSDIDIMYVNFHQNRTISFWDIRRVNARAVSWANQILHVNFKSTNHNH